MAVLGHFTVYGDSNLVTQTWLFKFVSKSVNECYTHVLSLYDILLVSYADVFVLVWVTGKYHLPISFAFL